MTVYIPVMGILLGLGLFALVGLLLWAPLVMWENRFISGRTRAFEGATVRTVARSLFFVLTCWPVVLYMCLTTEIKYRKKGYL